MRLYFGAYPIECLWKSIGAYLLTTVSISPFLILPGIGVYYYGTVSLDEPTVTYVGLLAVEVCSSCGGSG